MQKYNLESNSQTHINNNLIMNNPYEVTFQDI